MSAESPRRGIQKGTQVISPQPVSDRSIIESVAGIINDIVPQAYIGIPNVDNKESITWARFDYADVNDPVLYPDYNEGSSTPPLLLVLGYGTGVQAWLITASGDATEVLSWRQGVVRTLRFLPNPKVDNDQIDLFQSKRPMVAICDSAGPGPQFCNIGFISLKTGEQIKSIKFKSAVNDVLANRRSVVVTFSEKIAVFDSKNLEDILTVTTCYLSPGPNSNPVALGTRWLAYSEKKLILARRSSGGSEGEGAQSYTATVLHAAKSLGKGLRGLGETVASTLTGNTATPSIPNAIGFDTTQPGVVTILDLQAAKEDKESDDGTVETVVAHFTAHSDAIVAMTFDLTGALLMTADRRGHDFHIFRIQPHPGGPTLAAVHHLYVLHRGDTTAKVQDMTFSSDARWAAVSTVRGTTHVFPIAPYGGPVGVRTHSTPHVVNRLSRFHRSAGLTADGTRSHSPVAHAEIPLSVYPYSNPRLPPYPHPTIIHPLAQIRQPSTLSHPNNQPQPRPQQRQRLQSEDSGCLPLKICSCFAPQRAWLYAQRDTANKVIKRPVDSLFIMACHGNMIQYDLEPKPAAGIPKEKVCDDTTIELDVEAKGQWPLLRSASSLEILPPLPASSPLLGIFTTPKSKPVADSPEDQWLSQVEIVTHAGPHRRLWMGPQFIFKTYNAPSGVAVNLVEAEAVEISVTGGSRPARSNPVNMPHAATRPLVPVVIDGSGSSYEQSPRFLEAYGDSLENENTTVGGGENQLREDLAEAMLETAATPHRIPGRRVVVERMGQPVAKVVNPLGTVITISADEEDIVSSDSYEMDSNLESLRSLCAQEGPASLDDFRQESQPIKNLTEICAEMRTTGDSAIDSLASEDIKEVVEKKALYAEAARLKSKGTINFDEAEAFTDVQMTLNLCAEAGKIPTSPMTQARENLWTRKTTFTDSKLQERKLAKAKYVVNYDEETVVFTDNRTSLNEITMNINETVSDENLQDPTFASEQHINCNTGVICKQLTHVAPKNSSECKKDTKEAENKISDAMTASLEPTLDQDHQQCEYKKSSEVNTREKMSQSPQQEKLTVVTPRAVKVAQVTLSYKEKAGKKEFWKKCRDIETFDSSFESIKNSEIRAVSSQNVNPKCMDQFNFSPDSKSLDLKTDSRNFNEFEADSFTQQSPHVDDAVSEYSILEENEAFERYSTSSNHSDEDLEHIHTSDVTTVLTSKKSPGEMHDVKGECYSDKMHTVRSNEKKSSKSNLFDDDMEHIQSSDIPEDYSKGVYSVQQSDLVKIQSSVEYTKCKNLQKIPGWTSVSPNSKLESSQYPEESGASTQAAPYELSEVINDKKITEQSILSTDITRCSTVEHVPAQEVSKRPEIFVNVSSGKQSESNLDVTKGKQKARPNKNRKKKDDIVVVVVSGVTGENKETVVRHTESNCTWSKRNKTPENDLAEELDRCVEQASGESRRFVHRDGKLICNEATSLDNIEIIDIDALRSAEAEFVNNPGLAQTAECKVSEFRPELLLSRPKKSKKSKKNARNDITETSLYDPGSLNLTKLKLLETEICQKEPCKISDECQSQSQISPSSWSSVVKKNKDQCSAGSYERAEGEIKKINLETKVLRQMESTSINTSKLLVNKLENVDDIIVHVNNEKDNTNEEYLDQISTPSKYKRLKSSSESEVCLDLSCNYSKSLSESQVVDNINQSENVRAAEEDSSQDVEYVKIRSDTMGEPRDSINKLADLNSSCSCQNLLTCENDILKHDYKAQSSDCEPNPEEHDQTQPPRYDSIASVGKAASGIVTENESVVTIVEELSSSSSRSSKEPSPGVEPLPFKEIGFEQEAAITVPSKKSDVLNANGNLMDTEEDNSCKENVEKCYGSGSSNTKKGRSKKKRRR